MAKALSIFLQPLAALWVLMILVLLWSLRRRYWRAAGGLFLAVAGLYVVGGTPLSTHLLASLERPYAEIQLARLPEADAVVLLGGMLSPSSRDVFGFHFDGGVDRAVTALEAVRQHKGRALVVGGGMNPRVPNLGEGEFLRRWMAHWKLSPVPVETLGACRDTRDEAERTRQLAAARGWRRIILVTSASHMRRAEATFRRTGLEVVCLPCDFEGLAGLETRRNWLGLAPHLNGFIHLERYLYERVGWWVYRWRGWL